MKRIVQTIIISFLGIISGIRECVAQDYTTEALNANNVVFIKGISESTDGIDNFKHFEIEASEAGNYYARFWLLPARYAQSEYTTFKVYINGGLVGTIQPTRGNWQSATINNLPTLSLQQGENIISIATTAPEFPLVESIKLSKNSQATEISAEAYNNYLEKAANTNGVLHEPMVTNIPMNLPSDSLTLENYLPIKYSFYTTRSLMQGDSLTIISSGSIKHAIDVFYYGQNLFPNRQSSPNLTPSAELPAINFDSINTVFPNKVQLLYTPATPDQIQRLNWKRIAEQRLLMGPYTDTLQIGIPLTGWYMIKLRSTTNYALGVADIDIIHNGNTTSYDSIPIYFSHRDLSMPANSSNYIALTQSMNFETIDPMIFIEGADGDRIVGYNDDASSQQTTQYGLWKYDAFISQPYRIKSTGLHICGYSSSNPETHCYVLGHIQESDNATESSFAPTKAKSKSVLESTAELSDIELEKRVSVVPTIAPLASSLTISSQAKISLVRVFNLSGSEIATYPVNDYSATVALPDLNIHTTGVYLFRIEVYNGTATQQKVFVQ